MEFYVFLAVMAAAAMHAGWNALLKGGSDPFANMARLSFAGGLIAFTGVLFVPFPAAKVWPLLVLSWLLHSLYRACLIAGYRAGDLTQVYPIARGTAPLITAGATALLLSEPLSVTGYAGIALLGSGVFLMSMKGSRSGSLDPRAVGFALATSMSISAYTVVDGFGARLNGSAVGFVLWEVAGAAVIMGATAIWNRGLLVYQAPQSWLPKAVAGAMMSTTSYVIATWAMTKAPIALVAALRETGVLFAALIGAVFLKEPLTRWRGAAACVIVAGVVLLRLN